MLKPRLTKEEYDAMPDAVKAHYVEKDGVYLLGVTPDGGLELMDPSQLKKTVSAVRAERDNAVESQKSLERTWEGLDPEKSKAALKTVEDMAGMDPEGKAKEERLAFEKTVTGKFEADQKKEGEKHKAELAARDTLLAVRTAQLKSELIGAAAAKAIADEGGSVDLLLPIIAARTAMKQNKDGTFSVVVPDKDGGERLSPVAMSTDLMTIRELVVEVKADKAFARGFDGSGASGSGAGRSDKGAGGGAGHKISAEDARDPAKYRRAKEVAEKAGKELELA